VVNVYQIAMVATLLPLAALGEVIGYHRIYLGGLLLFTLASLLCACAGSLPSLLTARVLQGLGAGGIMGVNTALVRFVYPGPLQGRGFGYNALVVATAFTIGPTIASGILAIGPWTWLFVINVPFGVVAILIGLNTLPRTPRAAHAFDFAMAAGCLGLLILGIGSAAHYERSGFISIELASAVLLGWTLIRRQAASPAPVLPIDLFRRPIFARSTATAICSFAVQASLSSPCHSTSRTFSAGRRSRPDCSWPPGLLWWPSLRRSPDVYPTAIPQQFSALGLALLSLGMVLLAMLPEAAHVMDIAWRMAVCGCGFGFFQAPNMKALMSSAPADRSGSTSGMVATARLTGQTIGAALAALCFGLVGREGATLALALGAVFAAVGCGMSVLRLAAAPQSGG
jgi:DHA2 family multidrug resistance protein-like MFS transporter